MTPFSPQERTPSADSEFDPTNQESVTKWYRSLRPDFDMNTLPLATHLDAISSFILSSTGSTVADSQQERNSQALGLLTREPSEATINALKRSGSKSLMVADLLVELTERDSPIPAKTKWQMLNFGATAVERIRDDARAGEGERASANNALTNILIARLKSEREIKGGDMPEFESRYKQISLAEAAWLSDKKTEKAGALFESLIGNVAKQYALDRGLSDTLNVRHGTIREDAPFPGLGKNGGYQFAHDVVAISQTADMPPVWVQVKWGLGSDELASRYDQSRITFVAETCEDDYMDSNSNITQALSDVSKPSSGRVDEIATHYGLDKILGRIAGQTQKAAGSAALNA